MSGAHARGCPFEEDVVASVVHATEPGEEAEVLRHLQECSSCRALVGELQETLSALGGAVEPSEPPPGLRDRILDAAARTPQDLGSPHPTTGPVARPPAPAAPPVAPPGPPEVRSESQSPADTASRRSTGSGPVGDAGSGPGRGRRGVRGRVVAGAIAALVAAAAIAGLGVYSAQLKAQRDVETARVQSIVAMVQQLGEPGTTSAFLSPPGGGAVVAVAMMRGPDRRVLPVGLPANGNDRIYVLWGLPAGGTPAPLGTFDVPADVTGVESVEAGAGGAGYTQFAISLEPGRVAPAAPSRVVAEGAV